MTSSAAVSAYEGFRIWAADYDATPNALLALEMRVLSERITLAAGTSFLDAGSGTGRWLAWAQARGVRVVGVDSCLAMLMRAERKPGLRGRSVLADINAIPLRDNAIDISICSFTMGYVASPAHAFREMARVSRRVIISDLHPDAVRAGWTRSFRSGDRHFEIQHFNHSLAGLERDAHQAGLTPEWRTEAAFGEQERNIFARAGKEDAFEKASGIPAVSITSWRKSSD